MHRESGPSGDWSSPFGVSYTGATVGWLIALTRLVLLAYEIIPESHRRGHETLATTGLMSGFIVMMMLDTLL